MRKWPLMLVALVVLSIGSPANVLAQSSDSGSAAKTVNVEFVLDVSGSMAEPLPDGSLKMDVAKHVLTETFASIPQKNGVNVGMRIYGYEGDNSDATKDVSCQSSKLVVPLNGVNRDALNSQVEALQPTGWTPIALSLQRAQKDFMPASKNVTNVIVLITDGVETCGGDPCATARAVQSSSQRITTNVVGLALTDQDQQTISCIAENGKGQLFGASSGSELASSLFSVLEKLDIVTDRGYIGGNAFSILPAGESGKLSVVAHGTPDQLGVGMPVVIRNNTTKDVKGISLSATARDANGTLLGAGNAVTVTPFDIVPGGLAITAVNFGGAQLPPDATIAFKVEPMATSLSRFYPTRDLDVVEANLYEDRIAGTLKNSHSAAVTGPVIVGAVCFDLDGNPLGYDLGNVQVGSIAKGETTSFQVTLAMNQLSGQGCPAFLVAGYANGTGG